MTEGSADVADTTLRMSGWRPAVMVSGGRDCIPGHVHEAWFKYWLRAVKPAFFMNGGAQGVDLWAEAIARAQGVEVQRMPITPDQWTAYKGAAGPMRNTTMLEAMLEHGGGYCVVFDGGTGTADMLRKAEKSALRVINMQTLGYTAPPKQTQLLF